MILHLMKSCAISWSAIDVHGLVGLRGGEAARMSQASIISPATIVLAGFGAAHVLQQIRVYDCSIASICLILLRVRIAP